MDTPPDQYSDDRGSYAYTFLLEKRRIELGDDMTHTKQNQEYLQVYIHKKRIWRYFFSTTSWSVTLWLSGDKKIRLTHSTTTIVHSEWHPGKHCAIVDQSPAAFTFQSKHYCQIMAAGGGGGGILVRVKSGGCWAWKATAWHNCGKLWPPGHWCGHRMGTCGQFRPTLHSTPGHYQRGHYFNINSKLMTFFFSVPNRWAFYANAR